ncbi:hypothetical protein WICPIJ_002807 [Wickerhamomyces pijperi]|uniref:DUF8032 domain-containing protein n=1 Tax=Wickerhamomyces pijperi TaxID=599730 RepID=A0A9P8Q936_WICPI|nr:hypothetical protein WICPIJ_002807 [Wickerhamomyces pijperi]
MNNTHTHPNLTGCDDPTILAFQFGDDASSDNTSPQQVPIAYPGVRFPSIISPSSSQVQLHEPFYETQLYLNDFSTSQSMYSNSGFSRSTPNLIYQDPFLKDSEQTETNTKLHTLKPSYSLNSTRQRSNTDPLIEEHFQAYQIPVEFNASRRSAVCHFRPRDLSPYIFGLEVHQDTISTSSSRSTSPEPRSPNGSTKPGPKPSKSAILLFKDECTKEELIQFEFSKQKAINEFVVYVPEIILSDLPNLTASMDLSFKLQNSVYPNACVSAEEYTGNRFRYESESNQIGWVLCHHNESIQGKRGVIQRAVDSWRNTRPGDVSISRRLKKLKRSKTHVNGITANRISK